jgi:hypothetical protein
VIYTDGIPTIAWARPAPASKTESKRRKIAAERARVREAVAARLVVKRK